MSPLPLDELVVWINNFYFLECWTFVGLDGPCPSLSDGGCLL